MCVAAAVDGRAAIHDADDKAPVVTTHVRHTALGGHGQTKNEPLGGSGLMGLDLYHDAVELMVTERRASTSFLLRRLNIGYNDAARLMDRMEAAGVVSRPNFFGKREVLK